MRVFEIVRFDDRDPVIALAIQRNNVPAGFSPLAVYLSINHQGQKAASSP